MELELANKNADVEANSIFFLVSKKSVTCGIKFRQALILMEFLLCVYCFEEPICLILTINSG